MTQPQFIGLCIIVALLLLAVWCMWKSEISGDGHDGDNTGAGV